MTAAAEIGDAEPREASPIEAPRVVIRAALRERIRLAAPANHLSFDAPDGPARPAALIALCRWRARRTDYRPVPSATVGRWSERVRRAMLPYEALHMGVRTAPVAAWMPLRARAGADLLGLARAAHQAALGEIGGDVSARIHLCLDFDGCTATVVQEGRRTEVASAEGALSAWMREHGDWLRGAEWMDVSFRIPALRSAHERMRFLQRGRAA